MEIVMLRGNVDLCECREGDLLFGAHGACLAYVNDKSSYKLAPHSVVYLKNQTKKSDLAGLSNGSRTRDGYVYVKKRIPETDEDIIGITWIEAKSCRENEGVFKKISEFLKTI